MTRRACIDIIDSINFMLRYIAPLCTILPHVLKSVGILLIIAAVIIYDTVLTYHWIVYTRGKKSTNRYVNDVSHGRGGLKIPIFRPR